MSYGNKQYMMEVAVAFARTVDSITQRINSTAPNDMGLLLRLMLSIAASTCNRDVRALDALPAEILIYGSLAREESTVGDIDVMFLHRGFYTMFDDKELDSKRRTNTLSSFLNLVDWHDEDDLILLNIALIDFHVLPVSILTDQALWNRHNETSRDPQFLNNAMSSIKRWDRQSGKFVRTSLSELRAKHAKPAVVPAG